MITVELFKNFKKERMSFSFELNSNKVVIFGPSGCGKTTLLKLIAGLYRPDSGLIAFNDKVFYCKKDSIDVPVHLRNIGYMPQEYSFPMFSYLVILKISKNLKSAVEFEKFIIDNSEVFTDNGYSIAGNDRG